MKVDFERLHWENYPSTDTPINADNLNRLEEGVAGLYSDVAEIEEELGGGVGEYVTEWLDDHVTPGGSTIVVDDTLSITGAAADAKKTGDEISDLKDGLSDMDDRVTALEEGGSGSGITDDIKQALLQIAEKVAYIDEDGQDYYDALEIALYPSADVVSISAVYTQSGTVYDTDTLESLKADLVVTANMSDHTTRTVTTYTLSGTLASGTSTITVTYGGKTDTFNVIVTSILYPLTNGEHTFTHSNTVDRTVTVTSGNHVKYVNPHAASTSSGTYGTYAIFDVVTDNGTNANTQNINTPSATLFTLPSGASVEMEISNIQCSKLSGASASLAKYAIALRSGSTSVVTTGDLEPSDTSKTVTKTMSSASNITCAFLYAAIAVESLEFDISLTVNGERWI